ncbi:MAG: hypothetical protein ACFFDT_31610 [Candidatus Hodarchaeota archaeon]
MSLLIHNEIKIPNSVGYREMPCYIRIFAGVFEKAQVTFEITPNEEEIQQLDDLLKKKLEEITNKQIKSHQDMKTELQRLQIEAPKTYYQLEQWLLEQIRKLRQKLRENKRKRKEISLYA